MKRLLKSLTLVALFAGMTVPAWGQASPSTEGKDFWVTFLQRNQDAKSSDPRNLKLTISAVKACDVTIENTTTGFYQMLHVNANSSLELVISDPQNNNEPSCYSATNETILNTALHVTSTEDISLFAGNYLYKSFDAANVLPTSALLDDYLIQTYPPSDHEGKPQGSHFAIVATEDNTIVDYNLTARTAGGKTGAQSTPVLSKGQVWYVWTGRGSGDAADLSGTTVKARNGKKIAVFQGCVHTNIPDQVRDRDHIYSQAMPTAYWGSEFGITASRKHRRDIVAVMALNDGTEVYINNEDGDPILVHTFDFSVDKKHYWTFEIGEELAYCADNEGQSPSHGQLPPPLVIDSSCYLTTSCPAGVHLFMVSNRYDNVVPKVDDDTLVSDPAMLWVSPIEQVIKEINFATYHTQQATFHFMNILTTTADVPNMKWNNISIAQYFHPLHGNSDYSYARIQIPEGQHHLQSSIGFLAHVYGYGERESYAYSCGSSTIQRSVTFNGSPLMIDSVYHGLFCVDNPIEMKLNIGNNDYESIEWNYGDGITYAAPPTLSNNEKKVSTHTYSAPGWYDLTVSAVYVNHCTNQRHDEDMHFSFRVVRPDTIIVAPKDSCLTLQQQKDIIAKEGQAHLDSLVAYGERTILNPEAPCYEDKQLALVIYNLETEETLPDKVGKDIAQGYDGKWYDVSTDVTDTIYNTFNCLHIRHYHVEVLTCLGLTFPNDEKKPEMCPGDGLVVNYEFKKGKIRSIDDEGNNAILRIPGMEDLKFEIPNKATNGVELIKLPTEALTKPGRYSATIVVEDEYCEQTLYFPLAFDVNYPTDIMKYKFNNVMAIYKPGHGGNDNYEFSNYEWHLVRNGQDTILASGPELSVLYLGYGNTFELRDQVYVVLTDKSGVIGPLRSCEYEIRDVPPYGEQTNQAPPATKKLVNRQIIINKGEKSYNIYGQVVQ